MTAEQWDRIQRAYHRISDLRAEEQAAALEQECGDDPIVRAEVLALLNSPNTGDLGDVVQQVAYDVATHAHERVGPYRLERRLGHGGMGTVYLGTRDDNEFERKVAIKFLNLGMDRPEYLRRFRQERQILADLEHPHIARLLEGGQSSQGQPYLVMEYVDGKPLIEYCRENALSRSAILELMAKICDAVQYAHSRLVVHRDLKPSNILVTASGDPKLLDFGIAKVLASGTTGEQPVTQNAGQLLTLDYASPEQVQGLPISTASDVYSLGVILYELLAGERPFEPQAAQSLIHCVLHVDPPKPGLRAQKNGLEALPAELDNVVMKAIAKEPSRRYASAAALADDLRRHLSGQPVLAHGESRWYVLSKFVRRHRVATAVAATLTLTVVALAIQLAVTNQRLARERDLALQERTIARRVSQFLVDLFGTTDPSTTGDKELSAREMLDIGARRLRSRQMTDPEVRANLQSGIGAAYMRMGRWQDARVHLEESMQLLRQVGDSAIDVRIEVLTEYSNLLEVLGELVKAEEVARELVEVSRQHRPAALALSLSTLGNALSHQMKYAEAEHTYREGLALAGRDGGPDIPLKANLALSLLRQGKFDESHALLTEVRELIRTHWGENSQALAVVADSFANLEAARGNYRSSLTAFEEAIRHEIDPQGGVSPRVAEHYCGMAKTYLRMRHTEEAADLLEKCAVIRAKEVKPDSFDALAVAQIRGMLQLQQNHPETAAAEFQKVLSVFAEKYGERHVARATVLRLLGSALTAAGDLPAAERHLAEAYRIREQFHLAKDPEYAELSLASGVAALRAGRLPDAERQLRESAATWERLRVSPALLASAWLPLAECLQQQGKREEAQRLLHRLMDGFRTHPPAVHGLQEQASQALANLQTARRDQPAPHAISAVQMPGPH
jgi:serine/threonine-protein kinase